MTLMCKVASQHLWKSDGKEFCTFVRCEKSLAGRAKAGQRISRQLDAPAPLLRSIDTQGDHPLGHPLLRVLQDDVPEGQQPSLAIQRRGGRDESAISSG